MHILAFFHVFCIFCYVRVYAMAYFMHILCHLGHERALPENIAPRCHNSPPTVSLQRYSCCRWTIWRGRGRGIPGPRASEESQNHLCSGKFARARRIASALLRALRAATVAKGGSPDGWKPHIKATYIKERAPTAIQLAKQEDLSFGTAMRPSTQERATSHIRHAAHAESPQSRPCRVTHAA